MVASRRRRARAPRRSGPRCRSTCGCPGRRPGQRRALPHAGAPGHPGAGGGAPIVAALSEVYDELASGEVALDLALEDVHTLVEARLAARLGDDAGRLHTARSRNDQVALDLRLFARAAVVDQVEALSTLQRAFLERAAAFPDAVMPGYTHLQRAQPILLAHHLLAYVEWFERDVGRLRDAYHRLNELPLGAGALAGVPYPTDRHYVAHLLAFERVMANSLDAVADRDFAVEIVAALALVQMHLSRLGEEWVLWSSAEFAFAEIDEAYATGSSIMPQKRNPDTAELIRGKAGRVYGHLQALLTLLKGLPLAYNKDLQEDKEAFFDAADTALACTRIAAEMVGATTFRRERLRAAAGGDFSTATDLADHLAQQGLPFREAHRVVGALVRDCLASGRELPDLSLAELRRFSPAFGPGRRGHHPRTRRRGAALARRHGAGAGRRSAGRGQPADRGQRGVGRGAPRRPSHARGAAGAGLGPAGPKDRGMTSDAVPGPPGDALAGSPPRDVQVRLATTPADWAVALAIRLSVFVFEQGVPPDEELDAHDPEALHVLAHAAGRAAGTGRYYVEDGCAIIGRMAVLPGGAPRRRGGCDPYHAAGPRAAARPARRRPRGAASRPAVLHPVRIRRRWPAVRRRGHPAPADGTGAVEDLSIPGVSPRLTPGMSGSEGAFDSLTAPYGITRPPLTCRVWPVT